MNVFPAIDLLAGKAVRLQQGRRDQATVFSDAPWELVADFVAQGASRIHVVDLDGAFSGSRVHTPIIERIVKACSVPVQVGGGLRDRRAVEAVFAAGARFAVLGTAAVKDPHLVETLCREFPDQIVVAVDASDGMVAVEGWVEASTVSAIELGQRAAAWGAGALLYTDVARDGTGAGPNVEATRALAAAVHGQTEVIASGGVATLDHLRALAIAAIPSVIVGRALYDRRFTLAEAIEAAC